MSAEGISCWKYNFDDRIDDRIDKNFSYYKINYKSLLHKDFDIFCALHKNYKQYLITLYLYCVTQNMILFIP